MRERRVPLPSRIPHPVLCGLAGLILVAQLCSGTDLEFAGCTLMFHLAIGAAFNCVGGLRSPNGWFVAWTAITSFTLPVVAKILLGEPGELGLGAGDTHAAVEALGAGALAAAAWIAQAFRLRQPLLPPLTSPRLLKAAAACALGVSLLRYVVNASATSGAGAANAVSGVLGVLDTLGWPFAVVAVIMATLIESDGARVLSLLSVALVGGLVVDGLYYGSKQGLFTPLLAACVAVVAGRARITTARIAGTVALAAFMVFAFSVAQMTRSLLAHSESRRELLEEFFLTYFTSVDGFKRFDDQYAQVYALSDGGASYYGSHFASLHRLTLIEESDRLIDKVVDRGPVGVHKLMTGATIFPKSIVGVEADPLPNFFGRWCGILDAADYTTGISFDPFATLFGVWSWAGVVCLTFLFYLAMFVVTEAVFGPVDRIWGAFAVAGLLHVMAEGGPGFLLYYFFRLIPFVLIYAILIAGAARKLAAVSGGAPSGAG